ncbi:MAG TPA: hypothetical protein VHF22_04875 [Planctomycetota bacterium]|nr:hypothetical protein [Planctomycetota bacterium]
MREQLRSSLTRAPLLAGIAALALGGSGCAMIVRGSDQEITVRCNDPKAIVRSFDGESLKLIHPGRITLTRDHSYVISAESATGQKTQVELHRHIGAGYLVCDILLGLWGCVIDAVTGAWMTLSPDVVELNLPAAGAAPASAPAAAPK